MLHSNKLKQKNNLGINLNEYSEGGGVRIFDCLSTVYGEKKPELTTFRDYGTSFFVDGKIGVFFHEPGYWFEKNYSDDWKRWGSDIICDEVIDGILTACAYLYANNQSFEKVPQELNIGISLSMHSHRTGLIAKVKNFREIYEVVHQRLKAKNVVFDGLRSGDDNWKAKETRPAIFRLKDAIFMAFGGTPLKKGKKYDHGRNAEIFFRELSNYQIDFIHLDSLQSDGAFSEIKKYFATNHKFFSKPQSVSCSRQQGFTCSDHTGYNLFIYCFFGKVPLVNVDGAISSTDLRRLNTATYDFEDKEFVRGIWRFLEPYFGKNILTLQTKGVSSGLPPEQQLMNDEVLKPLEEEYIRLQKKQSRLSDKKKASYNARIDAFQQAIQAIKASSTQYTNNQDKKACQESLIKHLNCLKNNPAIEKYKPYQKLLLKLLNAVVFIFTGILPGIIKYAKTRSLFFSIEGKSKNIVNDTLKKLTKMKSSPA